MGLAYIKVFTDWLDALEEYGDAERGRLFTALLEYGRTGEAKRLSGNERFIFPMMRMQIDRQNEEYENLCNRNARNRKGNAAPVVTSRDELSPVVTSRDQSSEEKDKDKEEDKEKEYMKSTNVDFDSPSSPRLRIDYQAILQDYNQTCTRLAACRRLSDARKKAISARLNTYSPEELHAVFQRAQDSDFLCGKNDRNWKANFDWLMKDSNAAKVLDGNYDNRGTKPNNQPAPDAPLEDWEKDWLDGFHDRTGKGG